MVHQIQVLQRKVDDIFVELANYESEKANLEVAKQAGMARRGGSIRLTKLHGSIRGAKLRLSNAEKKLREALASADSESSYQSPLPRTSDSHLVDNGAIQSQGIQSQGVNVSELEPMHIDNAPINQPVAPQVVLGKGTEADLPTKSSGLIADGAILLVSVNAPTTSSTHSLSQVFDASPHNTILSGNTIDPPDVNMNPPDDPQVDSLAFSRLLTVSPSVFLSPGLIMAPDPTTVQPSQASLSQVENEETEYSVGGKLDMSLITPEDRAQLQQQLFKRRFVVNGPSSKKRVRYVEVSEDLDATGDPNIFNDDDEDTGRPDETGVTKPGYLSTTVVVQPSALPPANDSQGSNAKIKMTSSKGKDREKDTKGGKRKGDVTLKGKEPEKNPKDGGGIKASEKISDGNSKDTNADVKDKEGNYHASGHSVAKAARITVLLIKQRDRLSDEAAHREFVEKWLNARSNADRPDLPDGIELIRFDPDYLPDVATADYHLAIRLLLNQSNNYLCIPHIKLNRKLVSHVDNLEGPVQIWGTPLPRNQNPNSKSTISRTPNHFHCGCHEKVALAGFVMWKTWKAKTLINGQLVVEGLHKYKAFHPREVLFILQFLKSKFGYTVEDMFVGSFDEEEELRKEARVMKKVANFCARRHYELIGQKMTLDEHFPVLEEELNMEWI